MKLFDDLLESSAKVADQVAKVAGEYIDKGKDKISEMSLESELSKAQRQLGALVYVLHKTGEQNDELLAQYIDDVAKIELQLESFKAEENECCQEVPCDCCKTEMIKLCPCCNQSIGDQDAFCRACGAKVAE